MLILQIHLLTEFNSSARFLVFLTNDIQELLVFKTFEGLLKNRSFLRAFLLLYKEFLFALITFSVWYFCSASKLHKSCILDIYTQP